MIKGYLLALCAGSSLDETVKNFTLFNLIENVGVAQQGLGQTVPFEVHFYCLVDPEAQNSEFEMRVVRVPEQGEADSGEPFVFQTGAFSRFRMRTMGIRLPKSFGQYLLHVEWRKRGEKVWNVDPLKWPLTVFAIPLPEAQASSNNLRP